VALKLAVTVRHPCGSTKALYVPWIRYGIVWGSAALYLQVGELSYAAWQRAGEVVVLQVQALERGPRVEGRHRPVQLVAVQVQRLHSVSNRSLELELELGLGVHHVSGHMSVVYSLEPGTQALEAHLKAGQLVERACRQRAAQLVLAPVELHHRLVLARVLRARHPRPRAHVLVAAAVQEARGIGRDGRLELPQHIACTRGPHARRQPRFLRAPARGLGAPPLGGETCLRLGAAGRYPWRTRAAPWSLPPAPAAATSLTETRRGPTRRYVQHAGRR
jgi:hypothetical protein